MGSTTVRAYKHLLCSCPCGSSITIFCLPWCGKTKPQVCLLFRDCWSYFTCADHSCLSSGKIALRSKWKHLSESMAVGSVSVNFSPPMSLFLGPLAVGNASLFWWLAPLATLLYHSFVWTGSYQGRQPLVFSASPSLEISICKCNGFHLWVSVFPFWGSCRQRQ